jgi:uncharacterized membrane protein YphA (DoxX/SURF4 family)
VARAAPWVGLAIRLAAAGIWLVVGAAKVADLARFESQVHAYRLLPGALEAPFAYSLPFVELGVGAYLAVGLLVRPAAVLGSALMLVFVVALAQAWARGLAIDCGCVGALLREPVGAGTVLRDAALGLPSLAMALWPARRLSLDSRLLGLRDEFALRWSRGKRASPPAEAVPPAYTSR